MLSSLVRERGARQPCHAREEKTRTRNNKFEKEKKPISITAKRIIRRRTGRNEGDEFSFL